MLLASILSFHYDVFYPIYDKSKQLTTIQFFFANASNLVMSKMLSLGKELTL